MLHKIRRTYLRIHGQKISFRAELVTHTYFFGLVFYLSATVSVRRTTVLERIGLMPRARMSKVGANYYTTFITTSLSVSAMLLPLTATDQVSTDLGGGGRGGRCSHNSRHIERIGLEHRNKTICMREKTATNPSIFNASSYALILWEQTKSMALDPLDRSTIFLAAVTKKSSRLKTHS